MAKKIRLIARLDVKNDHLVKGIQLEGLRKLGDPHDFAADYYRQGVDELLYMDIVASLYNRNNLSAIVRRTTDDVFIPITVGGGLRSVYAHDNVLSFERYAETEGGEDALFVAVNRSMENAVIPGLHLDNAEFIFGAPYPNPAGGDFKLPPFGFTLLRIHREKTENGES